MLLNSYASTKMKDNYSYLFRWWGNIFHLLFCHIKGTLAWNVLVSTSLAKRAYLSLWLTTSSNFVGLSLRDLVIGVRAERWGPEYWSIELVGQWVSGMLGMWMDRSALNTARGVISNLVQKSISNAENSTLLFEFTARDESSCGCWMLLCSWTR